LVFLDAKDDVLPFLFPLLDIEPPLPSRESAVPSGCVVFAEHFEELRNGLCEFVRLLHHTKAHKMTSLLKHLPHLDPRTKNQFQQNSISLVYGMGLKGGFVSRADNKER
jgi:hypothetical protein